MTNPIVVVDYDPQWPGVFAGIRQVLVIALADVPVVAIEHVGSTSVPGLAAKPVIDICLAVADPADEQAYLPALEGAGYVLRFREPDWFEHRLLNGPDVDVNLHVFGAGAAEIDRMLRFRDRLRSDPADRELYAWTKRVLAARTWAYVQNYADAKSEVVADIAARAARRDEA